MKNDMPTGALRKLLSELSLVDLGAEDFLQWRPSSCE